MTRSQWRLIAYDVVAGTCSMHEPFTQEHVRVKREHTSTCVVKTIGSIFERLSRNQVLVFRRRTRCRLKGVIYAPIKAHRSTVCVTGKYVIDCVEGAYGRTARGFVGGWLRVCRDFRRASVQRRCSDG